MKLQSKDIGLERDKKNVTKSAAVHHVNFDNEVKRGHQNDSTSNARSTRRR